MYTQMMTIMTLIRRANGDERVGQERTKILRMMKRILIMKEERYAELARGITRGHSGFCISYRTT